MYVDIIKAVYVMINKIIKAIFYGSSKSWPWAGAGKDVNTATGNANGSADKNPLTLDFADFQLAFT